MKEYTVTNAQMRVIAASISMLEALEQHPRLTVQERKNVRHQHEDANTVFVNIMQNATARPLADRKSAE